MHFVLLGGCKSQTVLIDPLMEAIAQDEELRGDEEQTLERSGFLATTDMIPGPVFFRTTRWSTRRSTRQQLRLLRTWRWHERSERSNMMR